MGISMNLRSVDSNVKKTHFKKIINIPKIINIITLQQQIRLFVWPSIQRENLAAQTKTPLV